MKRTTHLMLGAAAGLLVAASASPPVAAGALWMGVAGGGFPDWLDLRSELRGSLRLRHRGASHGLPFAIVVTLLVGIGLRALAGASLGLDISEGTATILTLAFGAGILSHLASDACTHAGIRPLLPLAGWKLWLLPRMLRGRSDGYLNLFALLISTGAIGLVI